MWRLADLSTVVRQGRFVAVAVGCLATQPAAAASLSPEELRILGKSLVFLQPRLTGEGTVAVVYDAANPKSHEDAEAISASIGSGLVAGGAVLRPRLVDSAALGAADFALVIVAAGANSESVIQVVRSRHALCVTGDVPAVQGGTCIMAIRSADRVEVLLNHRAAEGAGIGFATAFRMMVQEL
jgi:hypothetical protein